MSTNSVPANRIPSLDGLRAMSILLVIIGHFGGGVGTPVILSALGVQVFFVLSGYLITTLLQKEHQREGGIDLAAFYRRRCFRIFPQRIGHHGEENLHDNLLQSLRSRSGYGERQ